MLSVVELRETVHEQGVVDREKDSKLRSNSGKIVELDKAWRLVMPDNLTIGKL